MKNNAKADKFRVEGNCHYQNSMYHEALICYNKSLCYSVANSPQLSLAYANRSAVYMELNLFDHCLENIQLARENNYPNQKKLNEREQKCRDLKMSYQPDPENDASSFFKLSYPSNEKIPFIANCLILKENEKYGRHIVTNQRLNPGNVIAIEEPMFKVNRAAGRYKRCTYCLKPNKFNLIPCIGGLSGGCSSAMFCSNECLNEAQKWEHQAECNPILNDLIQKSIKDKIIESQTMTKLRIDSAILQSLKITQSLGRIRELMSNDSLKTIFDFNLNLEDQHEKNVINLTVVNALKENSNVDLKEANMENTRNRLKDIRLAMNLKPFLTSEKDEKDLVKFASHIMMISVRNSTGLGHDDLEATGILLFGSYFSHACDPNVKL